MISDVDVKIEVPEMNEEFFTGGRGWSNNADHELAHQPHSSTSFDTNRKPVIDDRNDPRIDFNIVSKLRPSDKVLSYVQHKACNYVQAIENRYFDWNARILARVIWCFLQELRCKENDWGLGENWSWSRHFATLWAVQPKQLLPEPAGPPGFELFEQNSFLCVVLFHLGWDD